MRGRKISEQQLHINTSRSKEYYADMLMKIHNYDQDERSTTRLLRRECKTCFYLKGGQVVLQAFTDYNCDACKNEYTHHNGGVPRYCIACSTEFEICVKCGSEL